MLTENFRQGIDFRINYQQEIYHGEITMPFSCNVYTKIRSEISETFTPNEILRIIPK